MFNPSDSESLIAIKIDAPDAGDLKVIRLDGAESISSLFEFSLSLVSTNHNIDLVGIIGKKVTLAVRSTVAGNVHYYHGIFCEFEQNESYPQYASYRALFVPRLRLHTLNRVNDVFTKIGLVDLLSNKLKEISLSGQDFAINLIESAETYPERSFVAQFEESNFNFLSRTMEHYGLYYYFDHGDSEQSNDVVKVIDHVRSHPEAILELSYAALDSISAQNTEGYVSGLSCKTKAHPASATLTSYNPRKAELQPQMSQQDQMPGSGYGDVMTFDPRVEDQAALKSINAIRIQEMNCQTLIYRARSFTAGIRSGYFIKINKHFREDFNTQMLVTSVQHQITQSYSAVGLAIPAQGENAPKTIYSCSFEAIPASQQFRPPRMTIKPKINGLLNAQIDPSETDPTSNKSAVFEDGRYKIQPFFINQKKSDGNGSDMLRMLTPFAGNNTGLQFGLRPGAEVLLAFVNGDPDLPMIVGAAFNSEDKAVLDQSNRTEHMMRSNSGAIIAFDDTVGKERITLFSQGASIIIGKNSKSTLEKLTGDMVNLFDV